MKSRKVVTRSGRGFRGYFPSRKLNRMVEWESLLERDAILHFEFSHGVVDYQEQPEIIYYEQDGETRKYHPDFALRLRNDELIHIEVKPKVKLETPGLQERFRAIAKRYQVHPAHFRILTEDDLRKEPRLSTLKKLASVSHFSPPEDEVSALKACLEQLGTATTFNEFVGKIGLTHGLWLIAQRFLDCDMDLDLRSPLNFVRLVKEADHDALHL